MQDIIILACLFCRDFDMATIGLSVCRDAHQSARARNDKTTGWTKPKGSSCLLVKYSVAVVWFDRVAEAGSSSPRTSSSPPIQLVSSVSKLIELKSKCPSLLSTEAASEGHASFECNGLFRQC